MTFLAGLLVGCILGIFSALVLALVVYAHRKPPIRGYQPLPPTRRDPPPMPECKPAREDVRDVGGIRYEHLGMTGEES